MFDPIHDQDSVRGIFCCPECEQKDRHARMQDDRSDAARDLGVNARDLTWVGQAGGGWVIDPFADD